MRGDCGALMPGHNSPIWGIVAACCWACTTTGAVVNTAPSTPRNSRRLIVHLPIAQRVSATYHFRAYLPRANGRDRDLIPRSNEASGHGRALTRRATTSALPHSTDLS